MKILIDRGHSYSAPGSAGYQNEVELTHRWGERIATKLAERGADFVVLPDGGTASQDLEAPVKAANAYGKDCVFLSIHCNAFSNPSANGSEIFVYNGAYSGKTKDLADAVYGAYRTVVPDLTNRGIKQADYYVLRKTVMSAALLELGFVTNEHDSVVISSEDIIDRGAAAIADALMVVAGQSYRPPSTGLAEGFYVITSKMNGKAIDLKKDTGELIVWDKHGGTNQQWIYVNGYFKSVEDGRVFDIARGSKDNGIPVICYQAHGGTNQQFSVDAEGHIIAKHSGKCLDIAGGYDGNGANIVQYQITGGDNQKWNFEKVR